MRLPTLAKLSTLLWLSSTCGCATPRTPATRATQYLLTVDRQASPTKPAGTTRVCHFRSRINGAIGHPPKLAQPSTITLWRITGPMRGTELLKSLKLPPATTALLLRPLTVEPPRYTPHGVLALVLHRYAQADGRAKHRKFEQQVAPLLQKYGIRVHMRFQPIAARGAQSAAWQLDEIRIGSVADIRRLKTYINDPAYQAIRPLRIAATTVNEYLMGEPIRRTP